MPTHKVQQRAIYCDTDSVAYLSCPGEEDLPLGTHLGDLTDQVAEDFGEGSHIISFIAGGPKNYSFKVAVKGDTANIKVCIKVRGISINLSCDDMDKLVTPYRDMGRLSRRQRRHNYLHAKTRSIIERSFGYDKGLWRRQKLMQVYNHLYLVDSVIASCVLSNFIKLKGQPYKDPEGDYILFQPQLNEEEEHNIPDEEGDIDDPGNPEFGPNNLADVIPDDQDPVFVRAKVAGRDKRNFIAFTLYPYDD
ncbi:Multiple RNA-binding domain-containing protein 1 [Frankliniella fusca]|uniref:Multiple RNA-binding domain-containing protein 1 n=1 Tax=Frankliniella fusca TaxID=407009 RepID=A0AAE1GYQ6_9NEOP|nr:Multiple RNA-binding domain-containing protein 1 [Frankliniella fusca]